MREMAAKEKDVGWLHWHGEPVVAVLPRFADVSAVGKLNVHLVRAGDDFEAAGGGGCFVDGEVGG